MNKMSCLVLQGGALRGVYTSGVLDILHEHQLKFDCLIGTSAGALNGANFVAGQPSRGFLVDYHYADDENFMGIKPLLTERQIFSFRYMFGEVDQRYPFDYEAFIQSNVRFLAVATSYETGKPIYLEKDNCSDMKKALQASSSLPLLSTPMEVDGSLYFDGGPSMPVGYPKAIEEGYRKIVLVLTRAKGYRKAPLSPTMRRLAQMHYRRHPDFLETMLNAPEIYNRMMDEIERLEEQGRLFVIRPSEPVVVSRVERDKKKLIDLYHLGKRDAGNNLEALKNYLYWSCPIY